MKGSPSPPPSRRLAAVCFADIVGFTRLASQDEAAAFRLVQLFEAVAREEIERHGGTAVKFMGDSVLAIFGGTGAAVDGALSLRDEYRRRTTDANPPSHLRIGIHVGDIIVSGAGDVYGDGINTASRLQDQAEPGKVVVSEDVWRQCRQRAEYRFVSLGHRTLKGLAEPVIVYEVGRSEAGNAVDKGGPTHEPGRVGVQDPRSIAVLPFDNLSRNQDVESLSTGLHIDLLTELTKVHELTVISRMSVLGYRGTDKPVARIARELNVGTVLEGSVQSAGHRVRLSVQLVDGRRETQLWAERYDRELDMETIFAMQNELAERIIESLRAKIVEGRQTLRAKRPTDDLEAFRLAAEARTHLDQRTEHGMRRALELFERATERDPNYSLAWAGVADALLFLMAYGYEEVSGGACSRAEGAIGRALEFDPDSAAALEARGLLYTVHREGTAAIRNFERAVELQPGYAEAHNRLSFHHLLLGHPRRALESGRRAVELNPLSPEAVCNLSLSYGANGEHDRALAEARRALELGPAYETARFYEGIALYHLGQFGDAMSVLEHLDEPWAGAGPRATFALAQVAAGDFDGAREQLDRITVSADFFALGLVHAGLGEIEDAFHAFQRVELPWYWPALAIHHYYHGVWEPLRDDPRYEKLLRKVERSWGLP